jgi:hypothetical protein
MWSIDSACPADREPLATGTPVGLLVALAGALGLCAVLSAGGVVPRDALRVVGVAAGHGALLATALGWGLEGSVSRRVRHGVTLLPVVLLAGAAALSLHHPAGAAGYLAVAAAVWLQAGRVSVQRLALGGPIPVRAVVLGGLIGAFLGGHMLLTATRTLGYRPRLDAPAQVAAALAYDVGANVLAAECFFRGALFNRLLRRWSFWPAASLATGGCVLRYVVDPLLPKTPELIAGTIFYVAAQSLANAWLLWWSGTLVAPLLSGLVFFAAYRLLTAG